jgi:hypothetical protein
MLSRLGSSTITVSSDREHGGRQHRVQQAVTDAFAGGIFSSLHRDMRRGF